MKWYLITCFIALAAFAKAQGGYKVGDAVADFSLKNVDNKTVAMADYPAAKGFIVIFTCNTCPVAQAYESRIIALHNKYAPKGYPVIAINPNDPNTQPGDSFSEMQKRAKTKGYSFAYLEDTGNQVADRFGATRTPHVYIISKEDGKSVIQYIGAIDNDTENANPDKITYAEQAVDALLNGKKPAITFTKAVGCSIKRSRG
ncbi:thioredoxin family protein [Pedobacter sp. BS3]|uniref:thioredoxin family protein n=1 Tax=Pedobacter sp. BS3 TaxID=2567937 RepID=UPI0011EBDCCA|nr:thioredoxin family protein [Pedobacter sp. BS3]TZF84491.1 thioredoxin family protein [Pedobacter sp. BS3]